MAMGEPSDSAPEWDFSGLKAVFINCTLKRSPDRSHTQGLIDVSSNIMEAQGVATKTIRDTVSPFDMLAKLQDQAVRRSLE